MKSGKSLFASGILLLLGALFMVPFGRLHEYGSVPWFLVGAAFMIAGYFSALGQKVIPTWLFWGVALAARFALLWQAPGDDIFRYIWEGRVLLAGYNPYLHSPDASVLEFMRGGGWEAVEHKTVTAIYPPLAEWIFAILAGVATVPMFYKLVFASADLVIAVLMARAFGKRSALVYAWNPLVIYSFAGGGHYDCLFVLALTCGWIAWRNEHFLAASLGIGAAVALKWLALPLVAWMLWQHLRQRGWKPALLAGILALLPFAASWAAMEIWTGEWSTQLMPTQFVQYARSAELLPAIIGWFWEASKYQNHLFLLPVALAWAWVIVRARTIETAAEWILFIALIFTPLLHAWYFTWLMPFAVKTRNLGSILLVASGFAYFLLYHRVESPGGIWRLTPWETALLWLPFVAGFLWSECRRIRKNNACLAT